MNKLKIKKTALSALFTAVIAACGWISVPTPFGVNLAFTLFGVCLAGFTLGISSAVASTVCYVILGAVGLPVFSAFSGGMGVLLGPSGGFLWGFIFAAVLCGIAKNKRNKTIKYLLLCSGVLLCHFIGVLQYSFVTGNNLWVSIISASLPFLLKDFIIVFIAEFVSKKIKI